MEAWTRTAVPPSAAAADSQGSPAGPAVSRRALRARQAAPARMARKERRPVIPPSTAAWRNSLWANPVDFSNRAMPSSTGGRWRRYACSKRPKPQPRTGLSRNASADADHTARLKFDGSPPAFAAKAPITGGKARASPPRTPIKHRTVTRTSRPPKKTRAVSAAPRLKRAPMEKESRSPDETRTRIPNWRTRPEKTAPPELRPNRIQASVARMPRFRKPASRLGLGRNGAEG